MSLAFPFVCKDAILILSILLGFGGGLAFPFFFKEAVIHQTCLRLLTEETDVFYSFSDGLDDIIMLEDLAVVHNLAYFSAWFFLTLVQWSC